MDRESQNHNPYSAGWSLMDSWRCQPALDKKERHWFYTYNPFIDWSLRYSHQSTMSDGSKYDPHWSQNLFRSTIVVERSPLCMYSGNTLAYARSLRLDFASLLIIASVSGHTRYRSGFSPFREGLLCHSCALRTLLALFFVGLNVDCVWFCWLVAACVVKLTQNLFISIVVGILPFSKPSALFRTCWIQLPIMYLILSSSVPVILAATWLMVAWFFSSDVHFSKL